MVKKRTIPKKLSLIRDYLDKKFDQFTKAVGNSFFDQNKDIKAHITQEIGGLAGMTTREFRVVNEKLDRLDVNDRVVVLEHDTKRIKRALLID